MLASQKRRTFFQRLFGSFGATVASPVIGADDRSIRIQESPIAGFQFHRGEAVWDSLSVGDAVRLVREPSNDNDPDAVAVFCCDEKLGYVPRAENSAVSQMLDRGENLAASISRMQVSDDPWQRIRITIFRVQEF